MEVAALTKPTAASPAAALCNTASGASFAVAPATAESDFPDLPSAARRRSPLRSPAGTRRPPTRLLACRPHRGRVLLVCSIAVSPAILAAVATPTARLGQSNNAACYPDFEKINCRTSFTQETSTQRLAHLHSPPTNEGLGLSLEARSQCTSRSDAVGKWTLAYRRGLGTGQSKP